jgi:hypothetical protein
VHQVQAGWLGMAGFFGVRAASGGGQVGSTCRSWGRGQAVADSARGRLLKLRGMASRCWLAGIIAVS